MLSGLDVYETRARVQIANYTQKILEKLEEREGYAELMYKVKVLMAVLDLIEGEYSLIGDKKVEQVLDCVSAQTRLVEIPNSTFTALSTQFFIIDDLTALRGQDGADGTNGSSAFVYIRYAETDTGTGISATQNSSRPFIAIRATTTALADPNNASNYTGLWQRLQGINGTNGANGANGDDSLVFIRYASSSDGADFDSTPASNLRFISFWVTTQQNIDEGGDPDDPSNYTTWQEYIGQDGQSAYVYIAYADSALGAGFTNTFNSSKDYIAVKATTSPIATPVASDFTGLWKNYKGAVGPVGPAPTLAIDITHAAILADIINERLTPNVLYRITNRPSTGVGETGTVCVHAVSTNQLSRYGTLLTTVPDWDTYNLWNNTTSYIIGDFVIWNGLVWIRFSADDIGFPEPGISLDWALADVSNIATEDFIEYEVSTDRILVRKDKQGNDIGASSEFINSVSNPINSFQWGRIETRENYIRNFVVPLINSATAVQGKRIEQGYSNFEASLDALASTTIDLAAITYAGIINLTCTGGTQTINTINNMTTNHKVTFRIATSKTITFADGAGNIITKGSANIVANGTNSDYATLERRSSSIFEIDRGIY